MKNLRKLRWALLGTSAALFVIAALCEWKRRVLAAQSNDVLRKGYEQHIADGQTQAQCFTHSIVINNRLMLAELVLISLSLLILALVVLLYIKYRSDMV